MTHVASWWHTLTDGQVVCDLCPVGCKLSEGQDGLCQTRGNIGGEMVAKQYGKVVAAAVDPIEKKPFYHYHPGRPILSVAAMGCNLHCQFCQNWTISQQVSGSTTDLTPEDVVATAQRDGSFGIAYTYSEPLVWYEFVSDTAALAHEQGLKNVIVSNGFINREPLRQLLPLIDAANIDLKSMDEDFYRKTCRAGLQPVLDTVDLIHTAGVHLEVTNLVIPGHNDSDGHFRRLAGHMAAIDHDIPLHLSAYRPHYEFNAPATPPQTLLRAARIAHEKLRFVYIGNIMQAGWGNTNCPGCGTTVIERNGYRTNSRLTPEGCCPECRRRLPIVVD